MKKVLFPSILAVFILFVLPFHSTAATQAIGSVDAVQYQENYGNAIHKATVVGWATDLNQNDVATTVTVYSPTLGEVVGEFNTAIGRNDVRSVYGGYLHKGFHWPVPTRFYDGNTYQFSFYVGKANEEYWHYPIGTATVSVEDKGLQGWVDILEGDSVSGWAFDLDGEDIYHQKTAIMVKVDDQQVGMGLTGMRRDDVRNFWANRYTIGNNHGYNFTLDIPNQFWDGKVHTFHVFALEFTEGKIQQIGGPFYRTIDVNGYVMQ